MRPDRRPRETYEPPDRRDMGQSPQRDYEQNDRYGITADTYAERDDDRKWRDAYASRVSEKQRSWNEWDVMAAEENEMREQAAKDRARKKPSTRTSPEMRRKRLEQYREMSRQADQRSSGQIEKRRDARENKGSARRRDGGDYYRGGAYSRNDPYGYEDARRGQRSRRASISVESIADWLFTPLTRAAGGVNDWLNEDISVTQGRGYDEYDRRYEPRGPPPHNPSEYDGRNAYDAQRMRADRSDDFTDPQRQTLRRERDEYYDRDRYDDSNFGTRKRSARDMFRRLGESISPNTPDDDAPVDAREFERLRNRR